MTKKYAASEKELLDTMITSAAEKEQKNYVNHTQLQRIQKLHKDEFERQQRYIIEMKQRWSHIVRNVNTTLQSFTNQIEKKKKRKIINNKKLSIVKVEKFLTNIYNIIEVDIEELSKCKNFMKQ